MEAKERHPHWRVVVETSGEHIVSIEPEMLAGREISDADEDAIRTAAHHLLGFIGESASDGYQQAIAIIEARLPLYTEIGQRNALRECISSIRGAIEEERRMEAQGMIERVARSNDDLARLMIDLVVSLRRKDTEQDGHWGWPPFDDEMARIEDDLRKIRKQDESSIGQEHAALNE